MSLYFVGWKTEISSSLTVRKSMALGFKFSGSRVDAEPKSGGKPQDNVP